MWIIGLAIAFFLFCFAGLLCLLYRKTEVLVVEVVPEPGGSRIIVTGVGSVQLVATVQGTLARIQGYSAGSSYTPATLLGTAGRGAPPSPPAPTPWTAPPPPPPPPAAPDRDANLTAPSVRPPYPGPNPQLDPQD